MKGHEYANLVARYLAHNYSGRGLKVYREVSLGKTIIGKDRRVDVFALLEGERTALAVECKYQDTQGTVDEKIPYALKDLEAVRIPACIVYAGVGFSPGIIHMLRGSHLAAFCMPARGGRFCDVAIPMEWAGR